MNVKQCSQCGGKSQVINIRHEDMDYLYRRRECRSCGHRWSTSEITLEDHNRLTAYAQLPDALREVINKIEGDCYD